MRAISLDKKGAMFTAKIIFYAGLIVAAVFLWSPVKGFFVTFDKEVNDVLYVSPSAGQEDVSDIPEAAYPFVVVDGAAGQIEFHASTSSVTHFPILQVSTVASDALHDGMYIVERKVKMEFSTVTMTHFPFFMSFDDGCAIHGIPTDTLGASESDLYQTGMITLADQDAQQLYNAVNAGMTVVVRGSSRYTVPPVDLDTQASSTTSVPYEEFPATSARSYMLVDVSSGQVFLDKQKDEQYPIASISKLITMLVASELIESGDEVLAPNGKRYLASDLYYPLLLQSDNEVANHLAYHVGYLYFVSSMNTYVETLGMKHTTFADPSGLSPKNISTASDLSRLAEYLYKEKDFILAISREDAITVTSTDGTSWDITNHNKLSTDPYFTGGKLGYTDEAGQTALSIFTIPVHNTTRPVAVVVLGSKDWKQDTRTLLGWLIRNTDS